MEGKSLILKWTKSKSYFLPLLDNYIKINTKYVKSCFSIVEDHSNCICLLVEHIDDDSVYAEYIAALKQNPQHKITVEMTSLITAYIMYIPPEIHEEYSFFIQGRYSQLPDSSKKRILTFLNANFKGINSVLTDIKDVLYKSPDRKLRLETELDMEFSNTQELSSKPQPEDETFYKKYYE